MGSIVFNGDDDNVTSLTTAFNERKILMFLTFEADLDSRYQLSTKLVPIGLIKPEVLYLFVTF